jgi:formate hydrogenlyase subunit 4
MKVAEAMKNGFIGQDFVNVFLGIWAFLTPWVIGHHGGAAVVANYVIVGILITLFASAAIVAFRPWQEAINIVLGAWLLVSPWLVGFKAIPSLMWSAVVIGVLVMLCSAIGLIERRSDESGAR